MGGHPRAIYSGCLRVAGIDRRCDAFLWSEECICFHPARRSIGNGCPHRTPILRSSDGFSEMDDEGYERGSELFIKLLTDRGGKLFV